MTIISLPSRLPTSYSVLVRGLHLHEGQNRNQTIIFATTMPQATCTVDNHDSIEANFDRTRAVSNSSFY